MKHLLVLVVVFVLAGIVSCEKNETYTLKGTVLNSFDRPVRNAVLSVKKSSDGSLVKTITSDSNGRFDMAGFEDGSYSIEVNATGYTSQIVTKEIAADCEISIEMSGEVNFRGRVVNSSNGNGLANASLSFTFINSGQDLSTVDTATDKADFVVLTDEYGNYEANHAPEGNFCFVVRADGFLTSVYTTELSMIEPGLVYEFESIVAIKSAPRGVISFVLTWGNHPDDLDLHLTGPMSNVSERFHCSYAYKTPFGSDAHLDVDDMMQEGPETITTDSLHIGTYKLYVRNPNLPDNTWVYDSLAKVSIVNGIESDVFRQPLPITGNTWEVCELVVTNLGLQVIESSRYINLSDEDDLPLKKKKQQNEISYIISKK